MAKRSKGKAKIEEPAISVPGNGAEAWRIGVPASANPYEEGDDRWEAWHEEWDAAADEAAEKLEETEAESEEGEEPAEKSVVKAEYRARYAEAGHPSHCGDELAILINNLCLTKAGIDMARFEAICEANGVDLTKYNRTTKGWQGRLRMTGRNILSGKVFAAGGVVRTPIEGAEPEYKMSGEWMAGRRKVKAAA